MKTIRVVIMSLCMIYCLGWSLSVMAAKYDPLVEQAQKRLAELGYEVGTADGKMGPKTIEAIKEFQQDHGLLVTGKLDEETLQQLDLSLQKENTDKEKPQEQFILKDIKILPETAKTELTFEVETQDHLSISGHMGTVPDKDKPGQRIVMRNMFHNGAVHHYIGRIPGSTIERLEGINVGLSGYVFQGSKDNPLTFRCEYGKGYVYAGGDGTVMFSDGQTVNLGNAISNINEQLSPSGKQDSESALKTSVPSVAGETYPVINDVATLKLVIVDIWYSRGVGITWPNNASWDTLRMNAIRLLTKYGKKETDLAGSFHPDQIHGMLTHDPYIGIRLADDWAEIYQFEDSGTMPLVKFRRGLISLKLQGTNMSASFSAGTECSLDGKVYTFSDKENKWLPENKQ